MKPCFRDILSEEAESLRRKMLVKLPEWAESEDISIPTSLSLEQCSSSQTAKYKAELVRGSKLLVDLTGGLGVDSWAFSRTAEKVIYNERDPRLAEAAKENFKKLGRSNIEVRGSEAENFIIPEHTDIIYLDPARRSAAGKKVFLPEDCSPNVIAMKDRLLAACPKVLVKLSPMADLSLLERRFGEHLSEIHVVGSSGECKEILCLLERDHDGECRTIIAAEDASVSFLRSGLPATEFGEPEPGGTLLEPCPAVIKAGCGGLLTEKFGIRKLDRNTELYCAPAREPSQPHPFFKSFNILEILPFNGKSISEAAKKYPFCEVSSKNLPISSDELRKKLNVKSSQDYHIFACANLGKRIMIVCKK